METSSRGSSDDRSLRAKISWPARDEADRAERRMLDPGSRSAAIEVAADPELVDQRFPAGAEQPRPAATDDVRAELAALRGEIGEVLYHLQRAEPELRVPVAEGVEAQVLTQLVEEVANLRDEVASLRRRIALRGGSLG